jgi:hypothetical protein
MPKKSGGAGPKPKAGKLLGSGSKGKSNNAKLTKTQRGTPVAGVDPTGAHGVYEGGVTPQDQRIATASRGTMLHKQLKKNKSGSSPL